MLYCVFYAIPGTDEEWVKAYWTMGEALAARGELMGVYCSPVYRIQWK